MNMNANVIKKKKYIESVFNLFYSDLLSAYSKVAHNFSEVEFLNQLNRHYEFESKLLAEGKKMLKFEGYSNVDFLDWLNEETRHLSIDYKFKLEEDGANLYISYYDKGSHKFVLGFSVFISDKSYLPFELESDPTSNCKCITASDYGIGNLVKILFVLIQSDLEVTIDLLRDMI